MTRVRMFAVGTLLLLGCAEGTVDIGEGAGVLGTDEFNDLNLSAGNLVLYEVQARTANACHPDLGSWWQRADCAGKVAPEITYRAEGQHCDELGWLQGIRLGTLDDLLEDTADYRAGITLRYIDERVGANALWLMPVFPNNDQWSIPAACDNLGSPYAVRDYLHVRGTLDGWCIEHERAEYSDEPCWGNGALERLIDQAHDRGMKVMLDVALNHFGHNYLMYDYADVDPIRERIARGDSLEALWDFAATDDPALVYPSLLDTPVALDDLAAHSQRDAETLAALEDRCPSLQGDALVRAFDTYRVALDWERDVFPCEPAYLEYGAPGFYLGANHWDPSTGVGDNFSSGWGDVKFLFHQEGNWHQHEFVRQREYMFRILNYWSSLGVDGFRLDHTTDYYGGMGPNEWDYIISKLDYYAWRRGQDRPIFLAEEFHDQFGMSHVVDIMTEGYLGDMTGRHGITKDTSHVERVVENLGRFGGRTFVMTALETHDELRLTEGTGFDIWTGAGFWGIGASTWSTPMLLMGQEFGEPWRLAFRKSDLLRSRFEGTDQYQSSGDALIDFYRQMIESRRSPESRALRSSGHALLRSRWNGEPDQRLFAQVKWSGDGNTVFALHNLWPIHVAQSFYIPEDVASAAWIDRNRSYRLVDVMSGAQVGSCLSGADLMWDFYVEMEWWRRVLWLRLELC